MTDAFLWALFALFGFIGWATSLVLFARVLHPLSNMFQVLDKIDERMDARISSVVERILARQRKPDAAAPARSSPTTRELNFPSFLHADGEGIGEQPDADDGLEIIS